MKKFSVSLVAVLAIVLAAASAFTTNNASSKKIETVYELRAVLPASQPSPAQQTQPSWYQANTQAALDINGNPVQQSTDFTSTQLNTFQAAYCEESTKICIVSVKKVDNAITEVKVIKVGDFSPL